MHTCTVLNTYHSYTVTVNVFINMSNSFCLVFTEIEASELVDLLSNGRVMFSIFNIDLLDDLYTILQKAYETSVPFEQQLNVVVLCRFFCVRKILRTVIPIVQLVVLASCRSWLFISFVFIQEYHLKRPSKHKT